MKFTYAVAALVAAAASVQATETNAQRLARGLSPLPPRNYHRRHAPSRTEVAKRATPSGTPSEGDGNCNTGPVQCCNQVSKANNNVVAAILGLLGLGGIADDILVGVQCSPLSVVGVGAGSTCSQRPVCCENNSHGGLISIGCIPST
ncbi:fungal hydrophobin [Dichomitus squalens LYAD-421 SS1]|uniref:fungal hydrophobin n=1 Tax=Dichomitus squalens (strain LYAD-421) TaxID=732165 RepID=UPI0004411FBF|nr:fungal hydrophobin [Dichomitus squalens LYAD-421 SS1]EJF64478.1 fungal hydrophobin [Dichomitus squalens LYAD-421 SS1]